jgi:hypothetical protein
MNATSRPALPKPLFWLADAPLFIDSDQVERFYDAVARPQQKEGVVVLETTDENVRELKGKLNLEVGVETTDLAALLAPFLAFVKPSLKGSAEGETSKQVSAGKKNSIEMHSVDTPQSQLEALTLFYFANYAKRVFFANSSTTDWRESKSIADVPRSLVFLDLPSFQESQASGTPSTKLIPTAAEFENGKIVQIYPTLLAANGERPPAYPEKAANPDALRAERKTYWQWFEANYSATRAMVAIEEAASANGKIRWIDYRLPLTADGETLHLHVCPAGRYDTGVVAYNFVKRGFKHGIRLIGTLKSEPDMNVLAIYDK